MLVNYYEEILVEIKELIAQGNWEEALQIVETELRMPYIPQEFLQPLSICRNQIQMELKQNQSITALSQQQIEEYLIKDRAHQIKAVSVLHGMNLRAQLELVASYLKQQPDPLAAALLIDSLIEQQIKEEITYIQDGLEMTFIPFYQEGVSESDGFIKAEQCLREWLENDNPSCLQLCMDVLIREAYLQLPIGFDEQEGELLAQAIVQMVYLSMSDDEGFGKLCQQYSLEKCKSFQLRSQFI